MDKKGVCKPIGLKSMCTHVRVRCTNVRSIRQWRRVVVVKKEGAYQCLLRLLLVRSILDFGQLVSTPLAIDEVYVEN